MKFLIISRYFPDIKGGVSDYTYFLSKKLAEKGIDVYILTSDDERINKNVQNVKVLPLVKKWGFKGINEIIKEIEKIKPDWIILQYVPYMYSYSGIPFWLIFLYILLKFKKYRICTRFHEVGIAIDSGKPKYLFIAVSQRKIAYLLSFLSDKIIVNIEFWAKILRFFKNKMAVIPVGSNIIPEKEVNKGIDKRDYLIIGSFGSAQKARRIDVHLKAVKILKDKGIKVKYIFIGEVPEYLKKMAKRLKIEAEFTGYLEREKVYQYLKSFDFFIFFGEYSGNWKAGINLKSSAVVAAFSTGIPIIGNKGFLTNEILEGYYIKCRVDEKELAERILKFRDKKDKIKKFKGKIKDFYENRLKWDKIVEKYIYFLLNIIDKK